MADIRGGLRFIRGHTWIWGTLVSAAFAYLLFLGPTEVLLPYVVKNGLHGSAGMLGVVFAAGGIGSIGAAVLMGQREQPRRQVTFIYIVWTLATLAVAGYGLATATWQLVVACLLFNALETAGTIVWATLKQRHVPASMLGRVSSLDWLISIGLLPLSFALTAPVTAMIGARLTLVGAGVGGAAITLAALFLPGMRDVEREGPSPQIGRAGRPPRGRRIIAARRVGARPPARAVPVARRRSLICSCGGGALDAGGGRSAGRRCRRGGELAERRHGRLGDGDRLDGDRRARIRHPARGLRL